MTSTLDGYEHVMKLCQNCGWRAVRATTDLCVPCWRYQRRTGQARPSRLVLRHLERTIEREILTG